MYKSIIDFRDSGFTISVCHYDELKLREFVKNESGLEITCLKRILNQDSKKPFDRLYLWLSYDLKQDGIVCLHGWLDHMAYNGHILKVDEFIKKYKEYKAMKDVVIVKHIPHASLEFPEEMQDIIQDEYVLNKYNLKMSDLYIDKLFSFIPGKIISAPYSRLWCDVEKFKDDSKEEMSKFGQGYICKKFYDGTDIFRFGIINGVDIIEEKNKYYDDYHKQLTETVKEEIDNGKHVLILDLHSFSEEQARSINKSGPFSDICIGVVEGFYRKEILDLIIMKIEEKGISYQINYPYAGSIIPYGLSNEKYKNNLTSIMLEVNKRIYL